MSSESHVTIFVGTLPDDLVLLDFRTARIDHLKLTPEQALDLAEGLVEAATAVARGRQIIVPGYPGH